MKCVIQSSMLYSFYLFLSILLCDVDSTLVSDSNAYIWISNCTQMFELYSNARIYIRMLKECVFSTCSWKMACSDDVGKKISQLHQEQVNACEKRFVWKRTSSCCKMFSNMEKYEKMRNKKSTTSKSSSPQPKRIALCDGVSRAQMACCRWRRLRLCVSSYSRNCSWKWNPCLRCYRTSLDKRLTIMTCFAF